MIFPDLPVGASVFIDANAFVYHFSPHPTFGSPSTEFLERINRQEIKGHTSVDVLRDVAHRIMTSGDAMIVAIMQHFGLSNLASHDDDFDRVPRLNRYAPV